MTSSNQNGQPAQDHTAKMKPFNKKSSRLIGIKKGGKVSPFPPFHLWLIIIFQIDWLCSCFLRSLGNQGNQDCENEQAAGDIECSVV